MGCHSSRSLPAPSGTTPGKSPDDTKMASTAKEMTFKSGMKCCCTTNPESYKVVAEIPNARLIEMTMAPGAEDQPHEHPSHSMFFATDAKLSIRDMKDGKLGEPHVAEVPAGAAPIFPPGGHQVKNIGDKEAKVIFVEGFEDATPCGAIKDEVKPFDCCPECYKILAENDDWITGLMTMEPGQKDPVHTHRDHLIYVLEGDEVTIYPDGDMTKGNAVPIKPFAGIPAPMAAGPIFSHHVVENSGKTTVKMLFFEMKK